MKLPNAPCRRSFKSALITVSFVHILSSTYSVKCSSGASVIGDFGSQWSSNSVVLNIPAAESNGSFIFQMRKWKYNLWHSTYSFRKLFHIFVRQMGISVNSSSNEVWLEGVSIWWRCHRATQTSIHLSRMCQESMTIVHWLGKCAASKLNHATIFRPLSTPFVSVQLHGTPNVDQHTAFEAMHVF